tara:strand:- start:22485 stop:22904 length:420 start_codon:yes stop_codon:yes gene_type:complete
MAIKEVRGNKDNLSRGFKDVGMSFLLNVFTKDAAVVKNENAIKQSIKNLVLTQKGEKLFQPELGSGVYELLFEPMDPFTADSIRDEIINTLGQYEPRISILEVDVEPNEDTNTFDVTVEYRIVGQPIVETVNFILQRPE